MSESILFITIIRDIFESVAIWKTLRVTVSMPEDAPMTITAVSAAGIAFMAGPMKSGYPGVSITLINLPS